MIVPLIVLAWIVLLWLTSGLCAAAKAGDRVQPRGEPASPTIGLAEVHPREDAEELLVSAYASPFTAQARAPESSLGAGDGIAA